VSKKVYRVIEVEILGITPETEFFNTIGQKTTFPIV
jgi:hypothetical protein